MRGGGLEVEGERLTGSGGVRVTNSILQACRWAGLGPGLGPLWAIRRRCRCEECMLRVRTRDGDHLLAGSGAVRVTNWILQAVR